MTLAEIIPSVKTLSREDKILLLNLVTSELTKEMGLLPVESQDPIHPGHSLHDSYDAAAILAQFLVGEQAQNV